MRASSTPQNNQGGSFKRLDEFFWGDALIRVFPLLEQTVG